MKLRLILSFLAISASGLLSAQESFSLEECVKYALDHNPALQKSIIDQQQAAESRREIVGALLPQVSGSGSIAYNFNKNMVTMPNFMNSMLPEAMRDPNADKYMTIPMGMNNTANVGASLVQQVVNFSLFNALNISKTAQDMSDIGVESSTDDIIAQTATFYYNAQVLEYGLSLFDRSIALMDSTLSIMTVNRDGGIIRNVDLDRVKVARTNLVAQKTGFCQALEVQKNLLKLTMGYDMEREIVLPPLDVAGLEQMLARPNRGTFDPNALPAFRLMNERLRMSDLQVRSAKYELLPTLTLLGNYNYYFMADDFYSGPTFNKYPMSMVSLSLKVPIFSGFSKDAKIKKARLDQDKASRDLSQLDQSLRMAHSNALMQMDSNRETLAAQRENMLLAEDVYDITEKNFNLGLNPLSDILNASSELIKAQISYVEALHNYLQSYMDLMKNNGTIRTFVNQQPANEF
ncbi:MAG: TolC family protein [Bacteroidales bacterium]|nr:TolC family protein [Bacteroidales bacterium]